MKKQQYIFWVCAIIANAIMDDALFRHYIPGVGWEWDAFHIVKQFMFLFFALMVTARIKILAILAGTTLVVHYLVYHILLK